jgi:hypothetical protein
MAQEFTIKSDAIETKINQLLPSQGGFQPGVDFSASTMVVPIVDLTESAEGSGLRQDLQLSFSLNSVTSFNVVNTTTNIVTTTGYYRVFGNAAFGGSLGTEDCGIQITDGFTTKVIYELASTAGTAIALSDSFDFIVYLTSGDTLQAFSSNSRGYILGTTRQVADVNGNLVNPT